MPGTSHNTPGCGSGAFAANGCKIENVRFRTADCYSLPFNDSEFDRLFCHALMEHLSDPIRAIREFHRVLKPGGFAGICSPDWGGFVLTPPSRELDRSIESYVRLQTKNGGDVKAGRKLGIHLATAGFGSIRMNARYECYSSLQSIGEYLAEQLDREGDKRSARVLREWSLEEGSMFAQTWVSAIACKE